MAWRFKPSKYKNTTPKVPKKEDTIFDLPIGALSVTNNGVQCSATHIVFCIKGEGGKLGVVPAEAKGRRLHKDLSVICAHSDQVDDFSFFPFHNQLLATCSRDEPVKLWRVGEEGSNPILEASMELGSGQLLGSLSPHSTASGLVAYTSTESTIVVDWEKQAVSYELNGLVTQGLSCGWSEDGKLLAASSDKGRMGSIWDPRAGKDPIQELKLHQGMGREARILFAGQRIVSSGFSNKRVQEIRVFDHGKWDAPVHLEEFTATTGLLIPIYDPDTQLVFLAGKGTNKLFISELQERQPVLSKVYEMTLSEQLLGACLGTKNGLNVMNGEVATFYELSSSSLIPFPCIVPRRSYREFHADLFPDTRGDVAGCSAERWKNGSDEQPGTISLAPKNYIPSAATNCETPKAAPAQQVAKPMPTPRLNEPTHAPVENNGRTNIKIASNESPKKVDSDSRDPSPNSEKENIKAANIPKKEVEKPVIKLRESKPGTPAKTSNIRASVLGTMVSRFRHVEVLAGLKANGIFTNLRDINTRPPLESSSTCVSNSFAAVPLVSVAGTFLILDLENPCKLKDGIPDAIYNKAYVTDLQWNPFNENELACGTDTGLINIWRLSKEDENRSEMSPARVLIVKEKVTCLRYHPLASDLLAVALSDGSISLWNTEKGTCERQVQAHDGGILSITWSADGKRLASIGKDLMLRIWSLQTEAVLLQEKNCLESGKAGRVAFVCEDRGILVVGFTKGASRQAWMYDSNNLDSVYTHQLESGVQPLIPHYDFDSSVLFLTGKGDRTVQMFEISWDSPYFLPLASFTQPSGHQAVAYHNKSICNVMEIEFQKGWRLTEKSLESLIFRVPRIKKDIFQSDLFPDAIVTWEPVMGAQEWLSGNESPPKYRSLCPSGITAKAVIPKPQPAPVAKVGPKVLDVVQETTSTEGKEEPSMTAPSPSNGVHNDNLGKKSTRDQIAEHQYNVPKKAPLAVMDDEEVKREVEASWSHKIDVDHALEQDQMEGVAEEEWIDE
ncbi:unnamed protein product, partial [Mesorhabditis belari]|uniref:Coronin-7 n=1 Tax=Mesorhabditis belari TaxID=2138241 RepID=A0AAF3E9L2_9BILA